MKTINNNNSEPVATEVKTPRKRSKKAASGMVDVRILPLGDGNVHTGDVGGKKAAKGDILSVALSVAESLEARGFGEIQ